MCYIGDYCGVGGYGGCYLDDWGGGRGCWGDESVWVGSLVVVVVFKMVVWEAGDSAYDL